MTAPHGTNQCRASLSPALREGRSNEDLDGITHLTVRMIERMLKNIRAALPEFDPGRRNASSNAYRPTETLVSQRDGIRKRDLPNTFGGNRPIRSKID